jgi:hypothetical protein
MIQTNVTYPGFQFLFYVSKLFPAGDMAEKSTSVNRKTNE